MGDLRHDAPTPALHGYAQCQRCRTWLRASTVDADGHCTDTAWCSRQAGVGTGRLDADTGSADVAQCPPVGSNQESPGISANPGATKETP